MLRILGPQNLQKTAFQIFERFWSIFPGVLPFFGLWDCLQPIDGQKRRIETQVLIHFRFSEDVAKN